MGIHTIIPIGTRIAKRTQSVEQTARANLASVTASPKEWIKSNALLHSMTYATVSLMRMEETGDLKVVTETIRVIQTFKCTINFFIVVWLRALWMAER